MKRITTRWLKKKKGYAIWSPLFYSLHWFDLSMSRYIFSRPVFGILGTDTTNPTSEVAIAVAVTAARVVRLSAIHEGDEAAEHRAPSDDRSWQNGHAGKPEAGVGPEREKEGGNKR